MKKFRFGVDLHAPLPGSSWYDSARELEALGYSTAFVPDHFDEGFGPIAAIGPIPSSKWSGTNIVLYPRSSTSRTVSAHDAPANGA